MKSIIQNQVLYFEFDGELDNLKIDRIRSSVISLINKHHCPIVKFDFKNVEFVDSTGIGFVLARYNQIKEYQGELILKNVNPAVRKVFALSGIFSIIRVENKMESRGIIS